jgi:LuxR family maltose regulon positive regulatory protein
MGAALQARLLRALLYFYAGSLSAARDDLEQSLVLAEPEGYIRTFVDEGAPMAALLQSESASKAHGEYVQKLLQAFLGMFAKVPAQQAPKAGQLSLDDVLIEPLTERELEVLRLVAEGLKYEEIADRLVVSLNTVRFHVKMIYSKLQANNKTRAVEAARRYGLL